MLTIISNPNWPWHDHFLAFRMSMGIDLPLVLRHGKPQRLCYVHFLLHYLACHSSLLVAQPAATWSHRTFASVWELLLGKALSGESLSRNKGIACVVATLSDAFSTVDACTKTLLENTRSCRMLGSVSFLLMFLEQTLAHVDVVTQNGKSTVFPHSKGLCVILLSTMVNCNHL